MQTCGLSASQSLTVQSAPADRKARCTALLQASEYTASEWPAKLCWYLDTARRLCSALRTLLVPPSSLPQDACTR